MYEAYDVRSIQCTWHIMYEAYNVRGIQCTRHIMYDVHYTVYTKYGAISPRDMLYICEYVYVCECVCVCDYA